MNYEFFQEYWWFIVSLLGAILVFLLFVQGGQSLFFSLGKDMMDRKLLVNSVGRKWEFTFTTLVVFGGAFFASFPMFYSTSFGGAYWVWMLILVCFVIQAVSYEYQNKHGNIWGSKTYQICLFLNGVLAPILLGTAVSTFFTGANFYIDRTAILITDGTASSAISQWLPYHGVQLHGLEAIFNPWNVVFGVAIFFLSRTTALLYFINNIAEEDMDKVARKRLAWNAVAFLLFFLPYLSFLLTKEGFAVDPEKAEIFMQPYKYFHNLIEMPLVLIVMLIGVVLVLLGIILTLLKPGFKKGIWFEGIGVVLTALALLLIAGWNNTAYYASVEYLQHSLTIRNSSSSAFTLKAMSYVSLLVPFVLAYMVYAWRALDLHKITKKEMEDPHGHNY